MVPNGVTTIEERAFEDCTSMTHISLPDSVTVIGAYAFGNCSSLTGVALSDSLTSIGDSVFWHCSGLISINIPDSVTAIAHSAFYGCSSLTGINIPDGVTSIGSSAFYGCSSLTSVNIPDGVTVVNGYTFSGCSSLTSIDIPDSVISIGDYAFKECKNLTSVDLPSRLSTIGQQAFNKCSSLTSIDIPVGVISIGNSAFYKCTRLTVIGFNSDAPVFGSEVFTEVTATAYYPKEKHSWAEDVMKNYGGAITWEPFENTYDYMVFDDHVEITSYYGDDANVVIPTEIDGLPVTSIGNYAFADCSGVTSIEIADSVTVISELAFSGCDSLKSVYFNGDAPEIWLESFRGIAATVYYPTGNNTWTEYVEDDSITWMDYTPCQHEYSAVVTSATCAEQGYTTYTCSICENTYVIYCSKPLGHTYEFNTVKEVTGNENGETILTCKTCGYSATRIIPAYLQYVVYPDHVEITGYIGKPTEVVIPAEIDGLPVTVIGDSAFYNCDEITTASIPDSVTVIGASAFQDCSLLTSIVIPDSVISIGVYAFQFCDRLNSVSLPKGITKIADHTFDYCWDLRSIDIPDSVTYIGDYAFYGSGLYSITIPHSITYIGKNVFEMCPSMMTIEFEEGVDSLESGVLSKCKELSSIHFKGDAPAFGQDSFEEVTAIAYYPASNPTWTADVLQDYGGTIAWVSYGNQKLSFTDVSEGAFFYDPVAWALDNGITNGTSATTFSPNDQCMRAHVVTFLWRAVGSPEPTRIDNPFVGM